MNAVVDDISHRLLVWFNAHGRHNLPWQHPRTPYRVWVSEVMLQQTQVATVTPYFERFVRELPTLRALAEADEDRVFALWSGLGYYRRARHLHRAAKICVEHHGGELPDDFDALAALPGIGPSTAGAILALAHDRRHAILDGNVRRVLARLHGVRGDPRTRVVEQHLWALAESHTPYKRIADYTQAIMDLGATVCTRTQPRCDECPLDQDCIAHRQGLTETLPERRPKRALPQRRTVMLVLRDARERILLQKRGPNGVWSGLWSLPEAEDAEPARRAAERLADLRAAEIEVLAPFLHTFTHYRLEAQPLLCRDAKPQQAVADAPEQRWCTREEIGALGLPAPVRKLLDKIT